VKLMHWDANRGIERLWKKWEFKTLAELSE